MSSSAERLVWAITTALALLCAPARPAAAADGPYPGIGRTATAAELAAWDIDVRPDLKGLPPGQGSVAQGQQLWEAQCASCHGVFGESNSVFNPLVGGTTAADVARGRVARLTDTGYPGRTTLMKLSSVSTLWDYIRRAMPWAQPKSLGNDEVYALTAYLLNLGGVLPDDFVLSQANLAEVQRRLPNRDGMRRDHALWPGRGLGGTPRPDVQGRDCRRDCGPVPTITSALPEHARNQHGNLAEQQRGFGAQVGVDTRPAASASAAPAAGGPPGREAAWALAQKHACTACHALEQRGVGPGFREIAGRHGSRGDAEAYLAARIRSGGQGNWGAMPMPPQSLPEADMLALARWLAGGAKP
jgi:cytochrome c